MIKKTVLFSISHNCQIFFEYVIVNSFYVLTELGYVLSVILDKKENVVLKMLLMKRAKTQLI